MTKIKDHSNDLLRANAILEKNRMFFFNGNFYLNSNNYWQPVEDGVIKSFILKLLQGGYKQTTVKNILDILQIKTKKTDEEINLNEKKGLINCLNGFLEIKTMKLIKHNPKTQNYFSTNQFQINYAPGVQCPRWLQFLDEIFEGDSDKEDKKFFLQEFAGYCLTTDTRHQKALFLLGNGSNGKSIILDVLEAILGKTNSSNLDFDQLGKQFTTNLLIGKLINICNDIDYKSSSSYGTFKRIVSGETILADRKNREPIKFRPHCKLIFAANRLPQATDTSRGYFRRLFVLKFNNSFEGANRDLNLKSKLMSELDGIFLWMISGLQKLTDTKKFTIPQSSYSELEKYLENSNSVIAFVKEICEIKKEKDCWVGYQELYNAYRMFCHSSGWKCFKKTEFRQELCDRQLKGEVIFNRHGDRGNHFQNIKIISN
ncbi:MAG TPA: phage/plasmid primase, P4 family [Bacteroidales bacterium]|mgnify:CR=1 FL=1|nr:phage/plasmid primase, P4 family [Bacteroidales bacterium]